MELTSAEKRNKQKVQTIMAKTHRNGDVVIRIADIVAAHIPSDDPQIVEIYTRYALSGFRFHCSSEEIARKYIDDLQKLMEDET